MSRRPKYNPPDPSSQRIRNRSGSLGAIQVPRDSNSYTPNGISSFLLQLLKAKQDAKADLYFNPFTSVDEMCTTLKLPQSKLGKGWRLTQCELGEIQGLPKSRGLRIATDGIKCVIYRTDNSIYIGHDEWWQVDESDLLLGKGQGDKKQVREQVVNCDDLPLE